MIGLFCLKEKSKEIEDQVFAAASGRSKNVQTFRRLVRDLLKKSSGEDGDDDETTMDLEELFSVLANICPELQKEDVSSTIAQIDSHHRGKITMSELYSYLIAHPTERFTVLVENAILSMMLPGPWKRELSEFFEERKWESVGVNVHTVHFAK